MNPKVPLPKALLVLGTALFLSACRTGSPGLDATSGDARGATDATTSMRGTEEAPFDATMGDVGMDLGADRLVSDDGPMVPSDDRFDLDCRRGDVTTVEVLRPRVRHPELPPPRLIGPLSTMRVASQRPLLRWALPAGVTGARVELCLDCECLSVLYRLDLEGGSGRPPERLPPGVVFWRLQGITEGGVGTLWSPTWEFVVGHRDRGTDAVYGGMKDYNGDGFDDMLFILPWGARVEEYHGSSTGLPSIPSRLDSMPREAVIGRCCHSSGDVNRDGYTDLVVIQAIYSGSARTGWLGLVYFGSRWGLSPFPAQRLPILVPSNFVVSSTAASDLDGDGFSDLALVSEQEATTLILHFGSPQGLRLTPVHARLAATPTTFLNLVPVGDFDADGYGDLVLQGPPFERVTVGFGAPSLATGMRTTILTPSRSRTRDFGGGLLGRADFNADGIQDLVVGEDTTIEILFGRRDGLSSDRFILERPDMEPGVGFGITEPNQGGLLAMDSEGSGRTQLLVALSRWPYRREISMGRYEPAGFTTLVPFAGTVYHFRSLGMALDTVPSYRLQNEMHGGFAKSARLLGDVNGDGFEDFVIGGDPSSNRVTLDVFYGSDGRPPSVPNISFVRGPGHEYTYLFNEIE